MTALRKLQVLACGLPLASAFISDDANALVQMYEDVVANSPHYSDGLDWRLCHSTIVHNNLGGQGPRRKDPEEILYSRVGKRHLNGKEKWIDLRVTVAKEPGNKYTPHKSKRNGLKNHCFGVINVAADSQVKLDFEFIWEDGTPFNEVFDAELSVYDIDNGKKENGGNVEFVVFDSPVEDLRVGPESVLHIEGQGTESSPYEVRSRASGKSENMGECPNPSNPEGLSDEQVSRCVTALYNSVAHFQVTLGSERGKNGRNFLFSGVSDLLRKITDPDPVPHDLWCGVPKVLDFSLCEYEEGEFTDSTLSVNNLGGQGPDASDKEEMRWSNVAKVDGIGWLDLVVVNTSNWEYYNLHNGHGAGNIKGAHTCLGSLNIKSDTSANFTMRLTKTGEDEPLKEGGPFDIPFTILDIDSQNAKNMEYAVLPGYKSGQDTYWVVTPEEGEKWQEKVDIDTSEHPDGTTPLRIQSAKGRAGLGNLRDNPTDPFDLPRRAMKRAMEVRFNGRETAEWHVTFGSQAGDAGRHFFFAGGSSIPTTQTTTWCACRDWPDASFDWAFTCDKSQLLSNNLGGKGPSNGDEEIRYGRVAKFNGHEMDLVVTAVGAYNPHDVTRNNATTAPGLSGCFGAINVRADTSVRLNFQFQYSDGRRVPEFGVDTAFVFSIYDIDAGRHAPVDNEEIQFNTPISQFEGARIGEQVKKTNTEPLTIVSTTVGDGKDNAKAAGDLDDGHQRDRSASVMYNGRNAWEVTLKANGGNEGRNFLFSGCRPGDKWLIFPPSPFAQDRAYPEEYEPV